MRRQHCWTRQCKNCCFANVQQDKHFGNVRVDYADVMMQGQHTAKSTQVLMLKHTVNGCLKVTVPSKSVSKSAPWAQL